MPSIMITGASKGFGRELLHLYLEKKWDTFPLVRDKSSIMEFVERYAGHCVPIVGDVRQDEIMEEISKVLEGYGDGLDVLINNAGNIRKNRGIEAATTAELIDHFDVHCVGAFRCTKAALPYLKQTENPIIINVSSRWGSIADTPGRTTGLIYAYQIAKSAQNMLSACLYQEFKDRNIRVVALHPGRLQTSVAAPDADTSPRKAALRLAEFVDRLPEGHDFRFHDLMGNSIIDW